MSRDRRRRPPYSRRGRIGFASAAWLAVLGAVVAAIALSVPAHSAPPNLDQQAFEYWAHHGSRVCADLDREPTVDGIATAGLNVINNSRLNVHQAGQVVGLSVHYTCPRHQHLIDEYVAAQHSARRLA